MPEALSPYQRAALTAMASGPLAYGNAGWFDPRRKLPLQYWSAQTIVSLEQRGLCQVTGSGKNRQALITGAGRIKLKEAADV